MPKHALFNYSHAWIFAICLHHASSVRSPAISSWQDPTFLQYHHPWTFCHFRSYFLNPEVVKSLLLATSSCTDHIQSSNIHYNSPRFLRGVVHMHNRNDCRLQQTSEIAYFALCMHYSFNGFVPNDHSLEHLPWKPILYTVMFFLFHSQKWERSVKIQNALTDSSAQRQCFITHRDLGLDGQWFTVCPYFWNRRILSFSEDILPSLQISYLMQWY